MVSWLTIRSSPRSWNTFSNSSIISTVSYPAFSVLTLLAGQQEEHLAHKNWVMRCWSGHLSVSRCKWSACGPADATATPSSLNSLKSRMVLPFWYRLTQAVTKNRTWNFPFLRATHSLSARKLKNENQGYRANIKLRQQTFQLTIKMSFFNKTNNTMIVDNVKELRNRSDREIFFKDILQVGTFH